MVETPRAELNRPPLHHDDGSSDCESDFILTQLVERPLAGVIAFVDVRLGRNKTINSGQSISERLTALGATIAPRLTKDVTHIVFKDGKTKLDRLDGKAMFTVSPLWVESCKRCNERVSEAKYPVVSKGDSTAGDVFTTPVVLGKIKRVKSMQPKPFEEEVARSVERNRKRLRDSRGNNDGFVSAKRSHIDPFEFTLSDDEEQTTVDYRNRDSTPDCNDLPSVSDKKEKLNAHSNSKHGRKVVKSSRVKKLIKKRRKILRPSQQKGFIGSITEESEKTVDTDTVQVETVVKKKPVPKSIKCSKGKENTAKTKLTMEELPTNKPSVVKVEGYSHIKRKSRNSFERKRPGIVLTSLEPEDREVVLAIVDKLRGFEASRTVDEQTTHVICGAPRRTVNVLAGIAKGCWLLSVDWVWKSLEAGEWRPEGAFEMVSEFPAAQFFRLEHKQSGLLYRPSLFHEAGSIYISQNTNPVPQELELLMSIAGAKITTSKRKADVCVGFSGSVGENTTVVSEQWVIESISEHKMLPLKDYTLNSDGSFVRADSPEL